MHVLVFRHVPFEGAGLIHSAMARRGIQIRYVDLYRGGAVPEIAEAAGLIFMGGPMSVNDPLPFVAQEMNLVRAAIAHSQPVMGICLGSQLIAKALGASVHRNPSKEIGWFDVHFTGAAESDPLFRGVSSRETVFHWHGETFDLPAGAVRLAYSDVCANQAVRFAPAVYGLQFHLEVTPGMIADWCSQDENCGDVRELDGPLDPSLHAERLVELSGLVFGRWGDLLAVR